MRDCDWQRLIFSPELSCTASCSARAEAAGTAHPKSTTKTKTRYFYHKIPRICTFGSSFQPKVHTYNCDCGLLQFTIKSLNKEGGQQFWESIELWREILNWKQRPIACLLWDKQLFWPSFLCESVYHYLDLLQHWDKLSTPSVNCEII